MSIMSKVSARIFAKNKYIVPYTREKQLIKNVVGKSISSYGVYQFSSTI